MSQISVPFFITTLGQLFSSHALITFATSTMVTKTGYLITSLVIVALIMVFALQPFRIAVGAVFWFMAIGVLGFLVLLVVTLFASHSGFVSAFNDASGGHHAYSAIIAAAAKGGFVSGISVGTAFVLIPIGFLVYLGFTFSNYAAGELRRPVRTYKISTIVVIVAAVTLCVIYWAALRGMAGLRFMQSSGALTASNPTEYAKLTTVPQGLGGYTYGSLVSGSTVLNVIVGAGAALGFFGNGLANLLMASRVAFSLSFDRLLPTPIADVNAKTRSPVYAVVLIGVLVAAFSALFIEETLAVVFGILLLVITTIFVIGSAAAIVLPFRRKELFEASPRAFRGQLFGVPTVSWLGVLSLAGCLFMDVMLATHTTYTGGYGWKSIVTLGVCATLGIVLYGISKFRLQQRGINLKLAMQELPPE
jgi:amino acid transporter